MVVRGHELVRGIERNRRHPRVGPSGEWGVGTDLCREHHERGLGRVADNFPGIGNRGIAVETQSVCEKGEVGRRLAGNLRYPSRFGIAFALDRVPTAVDVQRSDGHLVHGQRAGLVRVDCTGRAECFDVGQVLHDGLGVGQLTGTVGQHRLDECWQAGRNRGHSHCDTKEQKRSQVLPTKEPDDDDDDHCRPRDDSEKFGERVQFTLKWRLARGDRRQHRRDLAYLRLHPGLGDHHGRRAAGDRGVLEDQIAAVSERNIRVVQRIRVLRYRRAFTGQCGFLRLQGGGGEQPSVGSDDVSCLDLDDVTRHQFGSVELNQVPVTNDPCLGRLHLGEGVDAGPCLQLLSSSEDDVEHDEHRHHDCCRHFTDGDADRGHGDEHQVHRIFQLQQRDRPRRRRWRRGDFVRPVASSPLVGLIRLQSALRVRLQYGHD